MLKLYDHTPLTFPSGKTWSVDELRANDRYAPFFEEPTVVNVTKGGVFTAFYYLDNLKATYGVTEADPQKAFEQVKAKMEEPPKETVPIVNETESILQRLDEQDAALMELAELIG